MTRRHLILAGASLAALVIALMLRDVVERTIITPLAYIGWVLRLYYSVLPQYILWIVLILVAVFSAISSLMPGPRSGRGSTPDRVMIQGQIAGLADWLNKSKRGGIYYRWLIANRLGKNAREILAQRDGQAVSKKFGRLNGSAWHPPQEVDAYLESGLNGSFADYPQPPLGAKRPSTPLDIDPQLVIEYLENEMEIYDDGNHKGS
jgi:hypothetical protein